MTRMEMAEQQKIRERAWNCQIAPHFQKIRARKGNQDLEDAVTEEIDLEFRGSDYDCKDGDDDVFAGNVDTLVKKNRMMQDLSMKIFS